MAPAHVEIAHEDNFGIVKEAPQEKKPCLRDAVQDIWGERKGFYGQNQWSVRVDQHITEEPEKWVQSACVMCSNGCGMDIGVKDGKIVGVRGRAVDRVNRGRLGPKGLYSWTTQAHKDRLQYPMIRKKGKLERASWDEAMDLIVRKTKEIQEKLTNHGIGFYTSGQLFLEEYYTLAVIGKAGLNTLHMDGNTRLCTATAAAAMRESFGSDGQPGSYDDIDVTSCIMLVGHNMSSTQTVLWARILDRLAGPNPPKIVVIDPRLTETARKADVHIKPKGGTNVAVLNGTQHLLFEGNYDDKDYIEKHTVGIEDLRAKVAEYTPEVVEKITGVPSDTLREAAKVIGESKSLLSTALQGVYQSSQATAAACQINNINLIMGKIGKPGSGIFQMNGQPTAQNNREAGCDGEFPAFRNHQNKVHMQELADHWNIPLVKVPHWKEPSHINEMLNYIQQDTIQMFWISGTNPLVSLPNLNRTRELLSKPSLFTIVQDIFMTETAQIADVVLPAAMWGEKTGCFTNVDRTVHISHKAVDPPGECKSDFDIWVDFATRMEFRDKDDKPLVWWKEPEQAFESWKKLTKNRPCDYTGLSYEKLTGGSGIQWPCNEEYPNGKPRLFDDGKFFTNLEDCESYTHDLETGALLTAEDYRLLNPAGRAILKACHYIDSTEQPDEEYPFQMFSSRNVYHFHTRTKTGRTKELVKAQPDATVQMNAEDADRLGIKSGDMVLVKSRRGQVEMPAYVGKIEKGQVSVPMHWGYFDKQDDRSRAGNELTDHKWDAISKQPAFKSGSVKVEKVPHDTDKEGRRLVHAKEVHTATVKHIEDSQHDVTTHFEEKPRKKHLELWVGQLYESITGTLAIFDILEKRHENMLEFTAGIFTLRGIFQGVHNRLKPFCDKHGEDEDRGKSVAEHLKDSLFSEEKEVSSSYEFLFDLNNLYTYFAHVEGAFLSLQATAGAAWDEKFMAEILEGMKQIKRCQNWLTDQLKNHAPQALIVPAYYGK